MGSGGLARVEFGWGRGLISKKGGVSTQNGQSAGNQNNLLSRYIHKLL